MTTAKDLRPGDTFRMGQRQMVVKRIGRRTEPIEWNDGNRMMTIIASEVLDNEEIVFWENQDVEER